MLSEIPAANIRVYTVWFEMFPGDSQDKWPKELITDRRSVHFWDDKKVLGGWYGKFPEYKTENPVLWDAVLLYGPEAQWGDRPPEAITWGRPVFRHRQQLKLAVQRLLRRAERPARQGLSEEHRWRCAAAVLDEATALGARVFGGLLKDILDGSSAGETR